MASPRHNPFCARCGITALLHAYSESSCAAYIAKGSKEARELSCDAKVMGTGSACVLTKGHAGRHETHRGVAFGNSELPTKAESIVIDSGVIDNRLVVATNEWLQAKIAKATLHLRFGFSLPKNDPRRDKQFEKALKALGGLGAG